MIHEHDALPLASAALDFELMPDAAAELRAALAECPVCAERAAAYREQRRLIARLPVVDVSERTRQRVTAAAVRGRTDSRPMVLLLAAALLLGLTLAIAAAAGAFRTNQPPIDLRGEASPSAPASTPNASLMAESTPFRSPRSPGSRVVGDWEPDAIVSVVSPNVRVRSQPRVSDDSIKFEPLLQPGDRLFVVEGPVVANDYQWYRVVPIGTDPKRQWSELPSGWIAQGDHDGTPWVAAASPVCPEPRVEIADLIAIHPFERIVCFGETQMSFRAVVGGGIQSGWHAIPRGGVAGSAGDRDVVIEPGGAVSPAALPHDRAVTLDGSFDQPDAINCDVSGSEDPVLDRLGCRSVFVVSRATPEPYFLSPGTAAITITDNLRVRSLPVVAEASNRLELLDNGTRMFVLDGPVVASGYTWYQVAVPAIRAAGGQPRVGWVAIGSKDGEQWAGSDEFDCPPPGELTFEHFAFLSTSPVFHGGLACYGRETPFSQQVMHIEANVRVECPLDPAPGEHWLQAGRPTLVMRNGGIEARATLLFELAALPCGGPLSSLTFRVGGSFDPEAADACEARADVRGTMADEVAVYECRTRFVVSELYPVGPGPTPQPSAPLN